MKTLEQIIREELESATRDPATSEFTPDDGDFVHDKLVELWNEGISRGINMKQMAEYMMNWSKMAYEDH